jgi:hypothetical protein
MTVALAALATVLVPLVAGAAVGVATRRALGRRLHGVTAALLTLALPAVGAIACIVWYPVIGLWDGVTEGVLIGVGFTVSAHRAFADRDRLVAIAAGSVVGLVLLEIGARLFLPPPPRFPTSAGVHFLLVDAIRASRQNQGWDMRSRELACAVVYGEQYHGMLDAGDETEVRFPSRYTAHAGPLRRELHVGDSMVFGLGVARGETFTAALETLEPTTEHVNAGIPGLAPDAYLAVLEAWIARQRFDAVTMYLFEGNDLRDLDGPYPCCGFATLLAYDDTAPHLRCAMPTPFDVTASGFEWIRYNSPPPYLLRTLVDDSAAAAHVAAALVNVGQRYSLTSTSTVAEQWEHLAAILGAARDELARRGTAFRVVIFPNDAESMGGESREHVELVGLVTRLGIPLLDATAVLRAALATHREIFNRPFDPHFNPAGHRLIAEWIHDSRPYTAETGVR